MATRAPSPPREHEPPASASRRSIAGVFAGLLCDGTRSTQLNAPDLASLAQYMVTNCSDGPNAEPPRIKAWRDASLSTNTIARLSRKQACQSSCANTTRRSSACVTSCFLAPLSQGSRSGDTLCWHLEPQRNQENGHGQHPGRQRKREENNRGGRGSQTMAQPNTPRRTCNAQAGPTAPHALRPTVPQSHAGLTTRSERDPSLSRSPDSNQDHHSEPLEHAHGPVEHQRAACSGARARILMRAVRPNSERHLGCADVDHPRPGGCEELLSPAQCPPQPVIEGERTGPPVNLQRSNTATTPKSLGPREGQASSGVASQRSAEGVVGKNRAQQLAPFADPLRRICTSQPAWSDAAKTNTTPRALKASSKGRYLLDLVGHPSSWKNSFVIVSVDSTSTSGVKTEKSSK